MILDLGLVDYSESYRIQKELVAQRKLGEISDSLVIAEHEPVYTIGRTGKRANLLVDEGLLKEQGIRVLDVDRGGDITFHGPGQLVVYPIVDLRQRKKDLYSYLRDLEDVGLRFLKAFAIDGSRQTRKTGVWVGDQKIASIGVGVSNWVTYHGISVNINVHLEFFSMINPCGMKDVRMTSLETVLKKQVPMDDAKQKMLRSFHDVFNIGGAGNARGQSTAVA